MGRVLAGTEMPRLFIWRAYEILHSKTQLGCAYWYMESCKGLRDFKAEDGVEYIIKTHGKPIRNLDSYPVYVGKGDKLKRLTIVRCLQDGNNSLECCWWDLYWFSSKDEAKKFANQLYEEDLNGPIPFYLRMKY